MTLVFLLLIYLEIQRHRLVLVWRRLKRLLLLKRSFFARVRLTHNIVCRILQLPCRNRRVDRPNHESLVPVALESVRRVVLDLAELVIQVKNGGISWITAINLETLDVFGFLYGRVLNRLELILIVLWCSETLKDLLHCTLVVSGNRRVLGSHASLIEFATLQ